jgi:hypothetical protein
MKQIEILWPFLHDVYEMKVTDHILHLFTWITSETTEQNWRFAQDAVSQVYLFSYRFYDAYFTCFFH